ncbi:MAG: hypothetical protein K2J08_01945 [Ruminococcus sp.]|nr:hypothetical protein [Ruminococcus sp.]
MNKYNKEDILAIIISFILILGFYFLVASGAVALASYCFGFIFAWKYVLSVWFVTLFATGLAYMFFD